MNASDIDYLLRRRFGSLAPPPVPTLRGGVSGDGEKHRYEAIQTARAEYVAMTPTELHSHVQKALAEDAKRQAFEREKKERALFFHQPNASADLDYWIKIARWTLEEGVALSFGKNPAVVNWEAIDGSGESYVRSDLLQSPFRREYARRRLQVSRASAASELDDPIKPLVFVNWAVRNFSEVDRGLLQAAEAWQKVVMPDPVGDVVKKERPLQTRERNNLLRVVRALCKEAKIDLDKKGVSAVLEAVVTTAGFDGPKERALRDIVKQAREVD